MEYVNKTHGNRSVHLGFIKQCRNGEDYGLLFGYRTPPYMPSRSIYETPQENKLFYFKKPKELQLKENTWVTYLAYDYNGFVPEAEYIFLYSSLIYNYDAKGILRDDGEEHDDKTWKLINNGTPFRSNGSVYYPIIENNTCTIYQGTFHAGMYSTREWNTYCLFNEIESIDYRGWPSIDDATEYIQQITQYVETVDAFDIFDRFSMRKECIYRSRPGKDDHYVETLKQNLPSDDTYLLQLLPSKEEEVFYDDNAYPSDGYKTETIELKKEAAEKIEMAKSVYSKEKHIACLISDFFYSIKETEMHVDMLKRQISQETDQKKVDYVRGVFYGGLDWEFLERLNRYNESTVVGALEVTPKSPTKKKRMG